MMPKLSLMQPCLQPENAPSASESSFQALNTPDNAAARNGSQGAGAEEEARQQIRSLRASSELENRMKNDYIERDHTAAVSHLDTWPVRLLLCCMTALQFLMRGKLFSENAALKAKAKPCPPLFC